MFSLIIAAALAFTLEKDYQKVICEEMHGQLEVVTDSGTRCDCLTETNAIEFDFAHKWAEAIGQSLDYGMHFKKRPGIVLIMGDEAGDVKYLEELLRINEVYGLGIDIWATNKLGTFAKVN